jgi:hypothetical protein
MVELAVLQDFRLVALQDIAVLNTMSSESTIGYWRVAQRAHMVR